MRRGEIDCGEGAKWGKRRKEDGVMQKGELLKGSVVRFQHKK